MRLRFDVILIVNELAHYYYTYLCSKEFGLRKMPQVKNAPSLLKLCLKCIQINIENHICAAAQFLNSVQLDSDAIVGSTSSPFHDLRK